MNKKHFFKTLFVFYVVFQLLAVLIFKFTAWNPTINAVLFTITVLLSLICSIKICNKQNPKTVSTNAHKKNILMYKTLLATQIMAMVYIILYAVFPTLEYSSVLSMAFSIFMIPEQILMSFFSNILYFLQMGIDIFTSNVYLDKLFLSEYPFIAMVIFAEVYALFYFRNKTAK